MPRFFFQGRYWILFFLFLAAIYTFAKFWGANPQEPEFPKVVETETVAKSQIKHEINLIGIVRPKRYCTLAAKTSGTVDTLIPAGSVLKKNDIIAKIENLDIEKAYNLSASAEHIARDQYERMLQLVKKGISSKKEAEDAHRCLIEAEKDLVKARTDLENTLVKAPFDGILGAYKIKDGEQVAEGHILAGFYNRQQLLVEFEIPDQYILKINPGQVISINGQSLRLTHVQKAIDEETNMCPASVELEGGDNFVMGESIDVTLVVEEKQNIIAIPGSAIFIKNNKNSVYVVENGKIVAREVQLGIRNKEKIEVLSGLEEKDELVTIGQDRLSEEMKIEVASKSKIAKTDQMAEVQKTEAIFQ
ncbi:MAG: efflux RND transporter periplasmic adaptor subunit [Holosporaceae bacterium]|jgi:membrane fusion protein (multidrug efflux system)|nr:efflux RND transporter periplasmic adaptor subunit [Holosporaceae bacterium]